MQRIETILVGMGHMGKHHFRVLQEDPRFDLKGVVDPVLAALPEGSRIPLFREVPTSINFRLAVIAAPTELHGQLVKQAIKMQVHVLVEKPAAAHSAEARELVELAKAQGVCLAVGNIERCNPVVGALRSLVNEGRLGRLLHLEGTRSGGYPANVKPGNNVFLDLAVHELDVFRMLLGPLRIRFAQAHAVRQAGIWDCAQVSLESEKGVTGTVQVDWFSPQRRRSIRVIGSEGQALVDYIGQTLELVDKDGTLTKIPVPKLETLKIQLEQLYFYISGQEHQLATGEQLIESVALVEEAQLRAQKQEA